MPDSALFRNAVAPDEAQANLARASATRLAPYRDWIGPVSVQVQDAGLKAAALPQPAFRLLLDILDQLARGHVVAVASLEAELTTQQAADVLGVSRPHLVKLLDSGQLPHRRVGAHRRVRFADLAAFRSGPGGRRRSEYRMELDDIETAIRAIAGGEMVIVVDDDDRENEGDLVMAGSNASPQQVAFMIRHTSGILCTPLTPARAAALALASMVQDNGAPHGTAFTLSVDYREGLTTGISAEERAATVRALADDKTTTEDFVRPGHVFVRIAKEGGVLIRSGHTEAAVDLLTLAGLPPAGLLAELVNDDGSVKRLPALMAFAKEHKLRIVSIADLIAYRRTREKLVHRMHESEIETEIGPACAIVYATPFDSVQHLALVFGEAVRKDAPLVRIHRQNIVNDVFAPGASLIRTALHRIGREGAGVIVYLREGAKGVEATTPAGARRRERHWREVGVGAQILKDLGLKSITLLTTGQLDYVGLAGFDIRIAATERIAPG